MIALLLSSIIFIIFTFLLWVEKIGEGSYAFLVSVTALFSLVLHGFARLQEFDLKNLRIVLRELKETKQELFVREEQLKSVALPLIQVLAYQSAASGRWSGKEGNALSRSWYKNKINQLITALDIDSAEAKEAQKFIEKYEEIDRLFAGRGALQTTDPDYEKTKAQIELLNEQIYSMLRNDIENNT